MSDLLYEKMNELQNRDYSAFCSLDASLRNAFYCRFFKIGK